MFQKLFSAIILGVRNFRVFEILEHLPYPKFIVSNQKEESISIQRVNVVVFEYKGLQIRLHNWNSIYVVGTVGLIEMVLLIVFPPAPKKGMVKFLRKGHFKRATTG